ncbi:MAG: cytochrome c oxidase subunit II [Dehalococcoidia bacterium]|nr:cytochrome c oxidase subunit II [Dehalococcoidia bacterium]
MALLVACDAPQSTTEIAGNNNDKLWEPYRVVLVLAAIVFVLVLVLTLGFSIWFRERPGRPARQIHGNTRLEVIWTLIPVAIVAMIAIPTFDALFKIDKDPPADAMKIEAIGHQWWFEFRYLDDKGETVLTTANELHLPEGKPVTIALRSVDVIHSFWVPAISGKVDMIPGHDNNISFTATKARPEPYLGQCAELCGLSHANMRFRVFVQAPADFDNWMSDQKKDSTSATGDLASEGEQLFAQSACIGCHTVRGTSAQGKVGPDLTHVGSRTTVAAGTLENNAQNLARWIRNSADVKPGSKMPPQGASAGGTLTDDQIAAIAAYLLSLR